MKTSKLFGIMLLSLLLIILFACQNKPKEAELEETEPVGQIEEESNAESKAEEAGLQLTKNDTYNSVQNGVRLILNYDGRSSVFIGTVENVTEETLESVRIEVHLSNGAELGPTEPIDLASAKKEIVKLSAEGQSFDWWTAHAEAGEGEHESEHEERR